MVEKPDDDGDDDDDDDGDDDDGGETWRQAGLSEQAELHLIEASRLVVQGPIPPVDVDQVGLVLVVEQLDDATRLGRKVLDSDHPHDVRRVLVVGIRSELVADDDASCGLLHRRLLQVLVVEHGAHDVEQPLLVGLEQGVELHVRQLLVDQDDVHVHILSCRMVEVGEKVGHRIKIYVAAHLKTLFPIWRLTF